MENPLSQPSFRVMNDLDKPDETFILAMVPVEWHVSGVSPIGPYAPKFSVPVKLDAADADLPMQDLIDKAVAEVPAILRALADAADRQIKAMTDEAD